MVPVTESARCARIGRADYAAVGDVAARRTASARRERMTATTTIAAAAPTPRMAPGSYDVRVVPSAMIAEFIRAILPRASANAIANATKAVSADASRSHSTREASSASTTTTAARTASTTPATPPRATVDPTVAPDTSATLLLAHGIAVAATAKSTPAAICAAASHRSFTASRSGCTAAPYPALRRPWLGVARGC